MTMALLQRRNPLERLALRSQSPVLLQFCPMELIPFEDMPQGPSWEMPFNNSGFQIYHNPMLSINCVEMSRLVLAVKHLDDATQKPADLRHDVATSLTVSDTGAAPFVTSNFPPLLNCHDGAPTLTLPRKGGGIKGGLSLKGQGTEKEWDRHRSETEPVPYVP